MLDGLEKCPAVKEYTRPEGGLFVFAALQDGLNAQELLQKAVKLGVAYVPGTHFYCGGGHENTLRLNFSMPGVEEIRLGMEKLTRALTM